MSRLSRGREGSTEATCSTLLRIDQDDPVRCRSTIESCSRRTGQDADRLDVFGVEVRDPFTGGTSRTEARTVTCLVSLVTDGHPVDYVEDVIVTSDGLIPRMTTRVPPPTPAELRWMLTPATLPFRLFMKLASLTVVRASFLISWTL